MRTTLVSYRALDSHPGRCFDYEFEDIAIELLGAELIAPHRPPSERSRRRRREEEFAALPLSGKQDLLFANAMSMWDLQALSVIPGWRKGCEVAVCWIKEFFACTSVPPNVLKILGEFDVVVLNFGGSVEALQEHLPKTRVTHLPLGIDALRFDPYPHPPARGIDVSWVGRNEPALHEAIFEWAERAGLHYHFNSGYVDQVASHRQHRALFAAMLKRTKLFVVQPAKFNDPQTTGGQQEVGYRYLEGAASGATLIGHAPGGGLVEELLPWDDAVVELPQRVLDVPEFLAERLRDEDEGARRRSVAHCLREHDWVYRLETLLRDLGLGDPEAARRMAARRTALAAAAQAVEPAPA